MYFALVPLFYYDRPASLECTNRFSKWWYNLEIEMAVFAPTLAALMRTITKQEQKSHASPADTQGSLERLGNFHLILKSSLLLVLDNRILCSKIKSRITGKIVKNGQHSQICQSHSRCWSAVCCGWRLMRGGDCGAIGEQAVREDWSVLIFICLKI